MGKKKHKHGKGPASSGGMPFGGLFAAAAAQATSPAGKRMIAGALRKAADALDRRPPRAPDAPVPPTAPANDMPPPHAGRSDVPPDVAKVIGTIAAGLERWAAKR